MVSPLLYDTCSSHMLFQSSLLLASDLYGVFDFSSVCHVDLFLSLIDTRITNTKLSIALCALLNLFSIDLFSFLVSVHSVHGEFQVCCTGVSYDVFMLAISYC